MKNDKIITLFHMLDTYEPLKQRNELSRNDILELISELTEKKESKHVDNYPLVTYVEKQLKWLLQTMKLMHVYTMSRY